MDYGRLTHEDAMRFSSAVLRFYFELGGIVPEIRFGFDVTKYKPGELAKAIARTMEIARAEEFGRFELDFDPASRNGLHLKVIQSERSRELEEALGRVA